MSRAGAFEVVPAVDVSEGRVVRVEEGDLARKTVYGDDPADAARRWASLGAPRIHAVDLDGAVAGEPRNREPIERLIAAVDVPVQVAGAVRTLQAIRAWRDAGADRVVVGTMAVADERFLDEAMAILGGRLVVALDHRDREIKVRGWQAGSGRDLLETASHLAQRGVPRFLVTDISKDGLFGGPNVDAYGEVAVAAGVPVLASGGVATLQHLRALADVPGIEGAIVGKALYDGKIDLAEALAALA